MGAILAMTKQQRAIIHEAIERVAECQESLRVTRTELELMLQDDATEARESFRDLARGNTEAA